MTSPLGVVIAGAVAVVDGAVPGRVVDVGDETPEPDLEPAVLLPLDFVAGAAEVPGSERPPEDPGAVDTGVDGLVVVGGLATVVVVVGGGAAGQRIDATEGARGGGSAGVALPSAWKRQPSTSPSETFHEAGPTLA
jgi:hypothetical protein